MSPPPPAARRTRPPVGGRVFNALNVLGVYGLVGGLFALGCAISREFISPDNLMNALRAVTLLGIVAVGLAFVTYSRHYVDLSIPGIMALSGTVAVWALKFGFVPSLAIGLAVGGLVGLVNGLVIGYLRLNPIIWTLAMMSLLSGVIRWAYAGRQIYPEKATAAGRAFLELYHHRLLGLLPLPVAVLLAVAAGGYFLMRHTGYGARLKLTGSAYEVARLTGINVRRVVAGAFVISSLTSAAAGVLLTSFNKVGAVYIGGGYDFRTITAVVLGGMTLAGGRGSIVGVLGGVAAIALMNNVMSLVRVGQFVLGDFQQNIVQGAVFILVVGINSFARRRTGGDDA